MKRFDVVALGEILIDMTYAGKSEGGQTLFEQNPGGAPANVLAAVQRCGGKTAFIGKVGNDMHGDFLRMTLEKEGICTEGMVVDESVFTTLAFVSLNESGERSFSFARKPGADTCLSFAEVKQEFIQNTKIFHVGSLSLTDEPAKTATIRALEMAKTCNCIVSYDPNYRASLWHNEADAIKGMRSILSYVDVIKISDEETELLTGEKDIYAASQILQDCGIKVVIITMGKDGAIVRTKDGVIHSPAAAEKVVDTTGAGDAFMGGFLWQLAKSGKACSAVTLEDIQNFADFANRVSGFCVGKRGAICAMPYENQL